MGTGGIKAGNAFIFIEAVDKTGTVLRKVSSKFRSFGQNLISQGRSIITKATGALIPAALSTRLFVDFDDAMKRVEARSAGTADEMAKVRKQAEYLGRTTSTTATQIGNLQGSLSQKGFNRSQILAMTKDIRNLSQAAGSGQEDDTTLAADLVSGTLRAYQMGVDQTARVSDVFTAAVNGSNNTLSDLVTSMSYAGPVAKKYNQSLEDTVSVLAVLRDLNIDASMAGTAYRNSLLKLSSAGGRDTFNKNLHAATGNTIDFVDAAGNLRPLPDLLFTIGKAMKSMGTAQQGDMLGELFGLRAVVPAGAMAESLDAFGVINAALKNSAGQSEKTAQKMDSGLGGTFRRLWSGVEGLAIKIGDSLDGALISLEPTMAAILDRLAVWIGLNPQLVSGIVAALVGLIGLGTALIVVGLAFKAFAFALGTLAAVVGIIKAGLALLASPVILLIGLIGFLFAHIIGLGSLAASTASQIGEFFTKHLSGAFDTLKKTFKSVMDAIQIGDLQAAWDIGINGLEIALLEFLTSTQESWEGFAKGLYETWIGVTSGMTKAWLKTQQAISTGILDLASQEGVLGDLLDSILGIDVSAEKARGEKLELQRQANARKHGWDVEQNDGFAMARNSMNEKYEKDIAAADSEAGKNLADFSSGIDNLGDRLKDRKQKQEELIKALEKKKEEEAKVPEDITGAGSAEYKIDNFLKRGPLGPQNTSLTSGVSEALEKGSLEAVKAFQQNRNNFNDRQLQVAQDQLEVLENIEEGIEDMASTDNQVQGV